MTSDPSNNVQAGLAQRARPSVWPVLLAVLFAATILAAAAWHVLRQPLPNQWDDSVYANATYDWLDFIENRGDLLRGMFWGAVFAIPHHIPPMVFITSLLGALIGGKTLLAMRLAHIVWLLLLLLSAYGVGKKLSGGWAGALGILLVGTAPLIFFWSKTVMGEPALFASIGLLLLALILFGQKTGFWGGIFIGAATGLGLLSKQQFPVSAVGPLALWGLWLALRWAREKGKRKAILLPFLAAVVTALVVAGPFYFLSYQEMLEYATQPAFTLHTMESESFFQAAITYAGVLLSQTGWPGAVIFLGGLVWGLAVVLRAPRALLTDWRRYSIAMLVVCALINLVVGFGMRNINTRFITPAFIPLGMLAALALVDFLKQGARARWGGASLLLALHLLFWVSLSFGPDLPRWLTWIRHDADLRPTNMQMTRNAVDTIEEATGAWFRLRWWVVGNYHSFNQPTFQNLMREQGYVWDVQELYHWTETEVGVDELLTRVELGDWVAIYRQERVFDIAGETLVSRLDDDLLARMQEHPDFKLVKSFQSEQEKDEVYIFRRIQK